MTRRILATGMLALLLVLASSPRAAPADETHACITASDEGQQLRDDHKLAAAVQRFVACSRDACPVLVRKACQTWLADVTAQQPSVVLGVRDATGRDLVLARVFVDGGLVTTKLDGSPLRIDPGQHVFRFEADGLAPAEQTIVARQGEANRAITVVLAPVSFLPVATAPAAPALTSAKAPSTRAWNTAGWAIAGAGALGLAAGGVLGIVAIEDNDAAHCNPRGQCSSGPLGQARTAAIGADVGFAAGSALLVGGLSLVLAMPRSGEGAITVTALTRPEAAGLALGGTF